MRLEREKGSAAPYQDPADYPGLYLRYVLRSTITITEVELMEAFRNAA
jgi:hypothetical protein